MVLLKMKIAINSRLRLNKDEKTAWLIYCCMNIGNYMNLINLLFEHWFPNFYLFLFYFYVKYLPSHDVNKLTGYLSYVLYRDSNGEMNSIPGIVDHEIEYLDHFCWPEHLTKQ